MAKYAPLTFKCPNCKKVQSHYTWDNDRRKTIHNCECGNDLGLFDLYSAEKFKAPGIRTETKNRY
jgi:phage FluMu protein Com